jgi:hypothetical protein
MEIVCCLCHITCNSVREYLEHRRTAHKKEA